MLKRTLAALVLTVGCSNTARVPFEGQLGGVDRNGDGKVDEDDDPNEGEGEGGEGERLRCDPGNQTLHRLNRTEYDNTIRDLLGVDVVDGARPAAGFPDDDVGFGFDNNGDVLSASPLLVEKMDAMASKLAALALATTSGGGELLERREAEDIGSEVCSAYGGYWNLCSNGSVATTITLPAAGRYLVRVASAQHAGGDEDAEMDLLLDNQVVASVTVSAGEGDPQVDEVEVTTTAGAHTFAARFTNDLYDPDAGIDRNLLVDYLEIAGPLDAAEPTGARARFVTCDASVDLGGCARTVAANILREAYRRPPSEDEIADLAAVGSSAVSDEDASFDEGTALMIHAALLSPSFVYRVELDEDPASEAEHALSDWELASRLSYFLWSSMPDEALFSLAADGTLREKLPQEIDRMLSDAKGQALVESLAGQWLQARALDGAFPDPARFPQFTEAVRRKMRGEVSRFVADFLRSDAPVTDMIDADFTYVDGALAAYYGIPFFPEGSTDDEGFARVSLAGTERAGVLTQGAFLVPTSYPLRTSPVKRGKWVLEQLLCRPPDPPPPGVEGLIEQEVPTGSVRERLEEHRQNPECAGCHALMDPIGFGLEHFDPAGRFRTTDDGFEIDDSGMFLDLHPFDGARELAALVKQDENVERCITEKITTYGLGRGVTTEADACTVNQVLGDALDDGFTLSGIVGAIASSDAFLKRRGGE